MAFMSRIAHRLVTTHDFQPPRVPASLVLIAGWSNKTTFNKELWTSIFPLYSIKPNLPNLFMKKLRITSPQTSSAGRILWLRLALAIVADGLKAPLYRRRNNGACDLM